MQLTPNFTLEEFERSELASRHTVPNKVPDDLLPNIQKLAEFLEQVRALFGSPIFITSGYRCKWLNDKVGSHDGSAHRKGFAADFRVLGKSPLDVCRAISATSLVYDQCIYEFKDWTHISIDPRLRCLDLTIDQKRPRGIAGFIDD